MALTSAGKLRREPCTKCALPVFIAERLNVGKLLFHRTCFRCARCNSQLTLANYYETENEEFCCEVCPDEEKHMFKKTTETLLSRSLSDEEKSASLKMITSEPDEFSAQFESALESVDGDRESESEFAQARSQFFLTQMEGSDSSTEDKPPDIPKSFSAPPKSQPPDLPESSPPHMTKSQPTVLPKSQLPDMPKSKPPDLPKSQPPFLSKSSPPQLRKSDKTDLQDSIVNSAQSDSSFPERLATTVNINNRVSVTKRGSSRLPLDESRNVVTKDKSAEEVGTSMVKARMRLFENNNSQDSFISKSDVNSSSPSSERVPKTPVKSPVTTIPIVKLEELENFDDSSSKRDLPERKNIFVYTPLVALNKEKIKHRVDVDNVSIRSNVEQTDTQNDKSVGNTENIEMKIEDELEYMDNRNEESLVEDVDESLGNPIIEIMDSTEGSQNDIILIEDSPLKSASDSILSKNEEVVISSEETSPVKQQTISSNDTSIVIVISDESLESSVLVMDESKESPVEETSEEEESRLKKGLEKTDSALLACVKEEGSGQKSALEITDDSVSVTEEYPDDLNPFGDDDVEKESEKIDDRKNQSLNPFGSDDEEENDYKPPGQLKKVAPHLSDREIMVAPDHVNPFDEEPDTEPLKPLVSPRLKKKVIPNLADQQIEGSPDFLSGVSIGRISVNPFETSPVPAARKKKKLISPTKGSLNPFSSDDEDADDSHGNHPVPKPRITRTSVQTPEPKPRETGHLSLNTKINFGSNSSISSGSAYGSARKKKPAPRPPIPVKFDESANSSFTSSPSHSLQCSPNSTAKNRKHKKAPAPPIPKFASTPIPTHKQMGSTFISSPTGDFTEQVSEIPEEGSSGNFMSQDVMERDKNIKDELNRNRKSQNLPLQNSTSDEHLPSLSLPNKSTYGKWKRRKGQAPSKPIPQKRNIKCLPMTEIRRELEFIEIQQQGLEKQGVRLEQIIREKCEGTESSAPTNPDDDIPIDVEDLILQLFELVNEKNELFRKQTELMYLRRQQRLEEEHADVEYQIRCLMLQPEANKTDSDKTREEELIKRLVDIVERRNEIVECLEMDRVREAEEDDSITNHINLYTLNRESDKSVLDSPKIEKDKDKKKYKKEKKSKNKPKGNIDMDKDIDESENCTTLEKKKKKKFAIF